MEKNNQTASSYYIPVPVVHKGFHSPLKKLLGLIYLFRLSGVDGEQPSLWF